MDQYGGDPSHCRDCMGQKYPPCDLFDESQNDVPLIFLISPMPLHLLIGIDFLLAFAVLSFTFPQHKVLEMMPWRSWRKSILVSWTASTLGTSLGVEVPLATVSPVASLTFFNSNTHDTIL